jgi:hypothetical protein
MVLVFFSFLPSRYLERSGLVRVLPEAIGLLVKISNQKKRRVPNNNEWPIGSHAAYSTTVVMAILSPCPERGPITS